MLDIRHDDDRGAKRGPLDRVYSGSVERRDVDGAGRACGDRGGACGERDGPQEAAGGGVVSHDARVGDVHHGRVQNPGVLVDRQVERPLRGGPLAPVQILGANQRHVVRSVAVQRGLRPL